MAGGLEGAHLFRSSAVMQGVFGWTLHEKPWRDRPAVSAWGLRCGHRWSSRKLPLGRVAGLAVVHRIQAVMLQPWGAF